MNEALAFWKTAHVLSAAILFGTGLGIAFFCWIGFLRALRTGDIAGLRLVLRLTVLADAWFTAPAVVFQAISRLLKFSRRSREGGSPENPSVNETTTYWIPASAGMTL